MTWKSNILSRWLPLLPVALISSATGNPHSLTEPSEDRWMYPSNATPGTRPQVSTFSALPADSSVDDRWAFFLVAFDTAAIIPPGLDPHRYRIRSMEISAMIGQDDLFRYDPTPDPWQTYATPDTPATIPDPDPGRPLELFGAGFRNSFTPNTFTESSPHGGSAPGTRNAYPLGFDPSAQPRDISNHVTQQFDPLPWATGQMNLPPGDLVPVNTTVTFTIDTSLPGVARYLQDGLSQGRLWFSLTSMHPATFQGGEFVSYHTRNSFEHVLFGDAAPQWHADIVIDNPLAITRIPGEPHIHLTWPVATGFTYTLQQSPDLSENSWSPIHTLTATTHEETTHQVLPTTPGGKQFFRLAITPTATP